MPKNLQKSGFWGHFAVPLRILLQICYKLATNDWKGGLLHVSLSIYKSEFVSLSHIKKHVDTRKSRLPFQVNGLTFGGELGTRTPDPLRVMHDDFSFFRAMIRQIEAICYRSATNGSFSTCISNLFFIFSLAKLSTPILSPRQKSLKCFVWFDDSIFSWRMIHWILRSYSVVLWLLI